MGKLLVVAALAAGCVGDNDLEPTSPELHELVTCSADWNLNLACERPCEHKRETSHTTGEPIVCRGTFTGTRGTPQAEVCYERMAFDYRGVLGCCAFDGERLDSGITPVRFAVCE